MCFIAIPAQPKEYPISVKADEKDDNGSGQAHTCYCQVILSKIKDDVGDEAQT